MKNYNGLFIIDIDKSLYAFFAQREYLYQNNFMSSSALSTLRTASAEV